MNSKKTLFGIYMYDDMKIEHNVLYKYTYWCISMNEKVHWGIRGEKSLGNHNKLEKGLVKQVEHMQVQNGREPSVWKSERPLLACHTCRKCSIETLRNSVKGQVLYGYVWLKDWSIEAVIMYDQASECHLIFVKGELRIFWYDPVSNFELLQWRFPWRKS